MNPKYSYLGASPDGIATIKPLNGEAFTTLVELKCRLLNTVDSVPKYFLDQVQGQMAIIGINQCILVQVSSTIYCL